MPQPQQRQQTAPPAPRSTPELVAARRQVSLMKRRAGAGTPLSYSSRRSSSAGGSRRSATPVTPPLLAAAQASTYLTEAPLSPSPDGCSWPATSPDVEDTSKSSSPVEPAPVELADPTSRSYFDVGPTPDSDMCFGGHAISKSPTVALIEVPAFLRQQHQPLRQGEDHTQTWCQPCEDHGPPLAFSACGASDAEGFIARRVLHVAKPPCHACIAFADVRDEHQLAEYQRLTAQHAPLLNPRTRHLLRQIRKAGSFPRRGLDLSSMPRSAASSARGRRVLLPEVELRSAELSDSPGDASA